MSDLTLELAIGTVVESYRADREGVQQPTGMQEAIDAARRDGHTSREIFGAADRRFGQELIDNSDQD